MRELRIKAYGPEYEEIFIKSLQMLMHQLEQIGKRITDERSLKCF